MAAEIVLVVDDEPDILELISYNLQREGFTVHAAANGKRALEIAASVEPHAIVLDRMLPDIDGVTVCRRLKRNERTLGIPVIILTAKTEESDVVDGLNSGADDYVTKPFSPKVLTARLRALLRRGQAVSTAESATALAAHGIELDTVRHEVRVDGQRIDLSATEFMILDHLMRHPGWVFSRNKIIDSIRGKDYPVTERSVDVQILGLRKKLGEHGAVIETVRGVGYRLRAI